MAKTILVTGGNSAIAMKLAKRLKDYQLILADYGEVPSLQTDHLQLLSLGQENRDITAHALLTACLDFQVDLLLPLRIFEIEAVAKSETLFNEFNISLMIPPKGQLDQFLPTRKSADLVLNLNEWSADDSQSQPNVHGAFYTDENGFTLITL